MLEHVQATAVLDGAESRHTPDERGYSAPSSFVGPVRVLRGLRGRWIGAREQSWQLPEAREVLAEYGCPAQPANEAVRRLDLAYQAAFRRLARGGSRRRRELVRQAG